MTRPVKARRPRDSLTRQQVVEVALELADHEGLQALSMPTLARRLECGVMTLYGYVDNKDDLLDAIALRALADVRLPRPLPSRSDLILVEWGRALRTVLLQHPSMPLIFLSRAVIGHGIFQGIEALLRALATAGVPPADGVHAIYAVVIYATGFVAWELPRTRKQPESAYAAGWRREFARLDAQAFPFTLGILAELPRVASDAQFELGLTALVRGLLTSAAQS
jgi:AcrR family transcriptional regulator